MNITEAQYHKQIDVNVRVKATIDCQDVSVPLDPDNTDYQEILKQVKEGTLTIKDAD